MTVLPRKSSVLAGRARLYFDTARHLRWQQLVGRLTRFTRRSNLARGNMRGALVLDSQRLSAIARELETWRLGDEPRGTARARDVLANEFEFLNHREHLVKVDWTRRYVSHLWSYHLHYFDFAIDLASAFRATGDIAFVERFEQLATSWIDAGVEGDGWDPYPLSIRMVNWIYALALLRDDLGQDVRVQLTRSLHQQYTTLAAKVEWHLLGNHVLKNFVALSIAELLFVDSERTSPPHAHALWRQIEEQVLRDGGHYERSPMYHALVLEDCLEVLALFAACGVAVPADIRGLVGRMMDAYTQLTRESGEVYLFQDSACGIAASRVFLDRLAQRAFDRGLPNHKAFWSLPETGYFGFSDVASGDRIVVDGGSPSPVYQPGHAHSGMLSFILDIGGRPVIVDSGVDGYADSPLREYVRSTRAHNTVSIDGKDQSEMWSAFRVARRGSMIYAAHARVGAEYEFRGACRSYHAGDTRHVRVIRRDANGWTVRDRISEPGRLATSFVHVHPRFSLRVEGTTAMAVAGSDTVRIEFFGTDRLTVVRGATAPHQAWYCPEFGRRIPSPTIEAQAATGRERDFGYCISVE